MKKSVFVLFMSAMSLTAIADEEPGMVIKKTDGSTVNVALSSLRSIKFSDGSMIINGTDNSQKVIAMDDVNIMTFSNISTAINAVVGTESKAMVITDMSGRIVYKGSSTGNVPASLHGVYIISVDGKSHKIALK